MNPNSLRREIALQFLFHLELPVNNEQREELIARAEQNFDRYWDEFKTGLAHILDHENEQKLIVTLKSLLIQHNHLVDSIEKYSTNWKIERISRVNFSILLSAIHELTYIPQTPHKVVINEAIELSKKYGDQDSKDFINGLLDKYYQDEIAS